MGLSLAVLAGCAEPAPPPAPPPPPGAVLSVAGRPVLAAEIEPVAAAVGDVRPEVVEAERVRTALGEVVLPRAAIAARFPVQRAAALEAAAAGVETLRAGGEAGEAHEVRGDWADFGLGTYAALRDAPEGEWTDPFEIVGSVGVARLKRRRGEPRRADAWLEASVRLWPYMPGDLDGAAVRETLLASPLEVHDPAYEDLVPADLRYRMPRPEDRP